MYKKRLNFHLVVSIAAVLVLSMALAYAQYWTSYGDNTRYLALGDSLSAGYGAHPATDGFVIRLYKSGVIDNVNNTLLNNIGTVNATSDAVLAHQLPLGYLFFSNTGTDYRKVVTITVGGNDLQNLIGAILISDPAEINALVGEALYNFGGNLSAILGDLIINHPGVEIYIANQYDPLLPVPGESDIIDLLNNTIEGTVEAVKEAAVDFGLSANITVVDIHGAFDGKKGLLLIERNGAEMFQVHPTNAGHNVMTRTFADAIRANR
ncbi:MAG: SGNH/GDSL hydrolase family protein [Acidobacteriota bacterium]|jgi:lysophospholipase L1-like esterase